MRLLSLFSVCPVFKPPEIEMETSDQGMILNLHIANFNSRYYTDDDIIWYVCLPVFYDHA